jgi:hypothetical protein
MTEQKSEQLVDLIAKLNLPKAKPIEIPELVKQLADAMGVDLVLTCSAAPEQYDVRRDGKPAGYIRARSGFTVDYPDAGGEELYSGSQDGFGAFTDHERESKLLFALGLIAARMNRA